MMKQEKAIKIITVIVFTLFQYKHITPNTLILYKRGDLLFLFVNTPLFTSKLRSKVNSSIKLTALYPKYNLAPAFDGLITFDITASSFCKL